MKYLIQIFRSNSWQNTAWGGDDRDVVMQRARAIATGKPYPTKWDIQKVRVVEVLIELEYE